jgi:hypothetical protein
MSRILRRYGLWKTAENLGGRVGHSRDSQGGALANGFDEPLAAGLAWRACSACAGDYEDPERTAGMPDQDDEETMDGADEDRGASGDEFSEL